MQLLASDSLSYRSFTACQQKQQQPLCVSPFSSSSNPLGPMVLTTTTIFLVRAVWPFGISAPISAIPLVHSPVLLRGPSQQAPSPEAASFDVHPLRMRSFLAWPGVVCVCTCVCVFVVDGIARWWTYMAFAAVAIRNKLNEPDVPN